MTVEMWLLIVLFALTFMAGLIAGWITSWKLQSSKKLRRYKRRKGL